MSFTPSPFQSAIFNYIETAQGNLVVKALAGSGKTATAVEALNYISPKKKTLFLAFNHSIAKELKERVPSYVDAMTLNSLGHRSCMRNISGLTLDANNRTTESLAKFVSPNDMKFYAGPVKRLIGLMKAFCMVPDHYEVNKLKLQSFMDDTIDNWVNVMREFDLMSENEKFNLDLIRVSRQVLADHVLNYRTIDFADQLYLPVIYSWEVPKYDFIFVDEAQDLSLVQRVLVTKACGTNTRLIAIGDPQQAIYAFRGADHGSIDKIVSLFNAKVLPLSICYRCSKAVIREAQRVVKEIQYHDNAPEGSINYVTKEKAQFKAGDAILCRANAPLISTAYELISKKIPAKIMGRDIGAGLVSLVRKMKAHSIDDLESRIEAWHKRETTKILEKDPSADTEKYDDKRDSIKFFISDSGAQTVDELILAISNMFTDDSKDKVVTLSSIHRAKGLEFDDVYLIERERLPKFEDAAATVGPNQEANLLYIAITRAKINFYYVEG